MSLSDIHQQATDNVDGELGTSEVPDEVYEDAIIDEARRILMERAERQVEDCEA